MWFRNDLLGNERNLIFVALPAKSEQASAITHLISERLGYGIVRNVQQRLQRFAHTGTRSINQPHFQCASYAVEINPRSENSPIREIRALSLVPRTEVVSVSSDVVLVGTVVANSQKVVAGMVGIVLRIIVIRVNVESEPRATEERASTTCTGATAGVRIPLELGEESLHGSASGARDKHKTHAGSIRIRSRFPDD